MCAPTHGIPKEHRKVRRHLPHNEQRNHLQVPEASRSEGGRAVADAYSMAKDGGTLASTVLLSESHRRRVRSCAVNPRTSPPKQPLAGLLKSTKGKGCVKENRRFYLHVQSPARRRQSSAVCRTLLGLGTKVPSPSRHGGDPPVPSPRRGGAIKSTVPCQAQKKEPP